jgi:hypothetical protein
LEKALVLVSKTRIGTNVSILTLDTISKKYSFITNRKDSVAWFFSVGILFLKHTGLLLIEIKI